MEVEVSVEVEVSWLSHRAGKPLRIYLRAADTHTHTHTHTRQIVQKEIAFMCGHLYNYLYLVGGYTPTHTRTHAHCLYLL